MTTKGEQTRKAILEAAIRRFGRDGSRATSVADIARDAGVSGTAAYAYYPNKEALFLAALDEDAAAVIDLGLNRMLLEHHTEIGGAANWRELLFETLVTGLEHHPLARRVLAGFEPEVIDRVLTIPALEDLRRVVAERLAAEQLTGVVRADIDPVVIANGVVSIVLSLLVSVVQFGSEVATTYAGDVAAVFEAAIEQPRTR